MRKIHKIIIFLIIIAACKNDGNSVSSSNGSGNNNSDPGSGNSESHVMTLQELISNPIDQFIIDDDSLSKVSHAHPFMGSGEVCAHAGAHIVFKEESESYLINIYAPVDSVIAQVRLCEDLGNGNDKYDILLDIADDNGDYVNMAISLEPFGGMLCESDSDYYQQFVFVEAGDKVKKGDLIAKLLRPNSGSPHTHICFKTTSPLGSHCPNIFTEQIVKNFSSVFGGVTCNGAPFGETLCYRPAQDEDITGL